MCPLLLSVNGGRDVTFRGLDVTIDQVHDVPLTVVADEREHHVNILGRLGAGGVGYVAGDVAKNCGSGPAFSIAALEVTRDAAGGPLQPIGAQAGAQLQGIAWRCPEREELARNREGHHREHEPEQRVCHQAPGSGLRAEPTGQIAQARATGVVLAGSRAQCSVSTAREVPSQQRVAGLGIVLVLRGQRVPLLQRRLRERIQSLRRRIR
jgi:hypothetical protein